MNIIRNTRLKKKVTQKQLAEMIGVSQAYISKIESQDIKGKEPSSHAR